MTKTDLHKPSLLKRVLHAVVSWCEKHDRYLKIYDRDDLNRLYLERWYPLFPRQWERKLPFNLYIHRFHASDRADLHDHPWTRWGSYILTGGYMEYTHPHPSVWGAAFRAPGSFQIRKGTELHRVELNEQQSRELGYTKPDEPYEVWTLFFIGRRIRDWGFNKNGKWVFWRDYLDAHEKDEV